MLIGQTIGQFAIEKELGSGAMGAVYLARYLKNQQYVAIKVMAPGLGTKEKAVARFQREADILKQLNHPNIVRFYGAGRFHGAPYYVMEYIQGEPLDHVLQRRGRHTWEEVVTLGQQLCAALQHAHQQGIVHRDLKPSNLMLLPDGTLKLTDFGIAKDLDVTQLTSANCTVGTASYMSPEQCRGERDLTHKSDLYSLGIVFYELLTGRKPFVAENAMDMFLQHVQGTFERPSRLALDIPIWLDTLVCQLLEKKPEHRPFDAAMVADALNRIAEKVTAQQSAGVDAAKSRAIDRSPGNKAKPNADDAEAARLLLRGRRKRRAVPFYQKVWFQIVGIASVLATFAGVLYLVFQPPSFESLYFRVEKHMRSQDPEEWVKAKGDLLTFREHYLNVNDSRNRQMREWARAVDLYEGEKKIDKLVRSRKGLLPLKLEESTSEAQAVDATLAEEEGNLTEAEKLWQEFQQKNHQSEEGQTLSALASQRLSDLQTATYQINTLRSKFTRARVDDREFKPESDIEILAVEALRAELFGDIELAANRWKEMKNKYKDDATQHPWFLVAAQHSYRLKGKRHPVLSDLIKNKLTEARKRLGDAERAPTLTDLREAKYTCLDIIALYDKDADLKDQVEEAKILEQQAAKKLQAQIPEAK